ncbi:MAG: transposase [Candidatus Dadabacteria bacterium]|nr:transposase [Candidatus Dadabacteria bacterium]
MKERKLNRLENYDYSQCGYYFVTVCTKNREEWFGKIESGKVILNGFGEVAKNFWVEIPKHFKNVGLDEFIVMPNHIHGIVIIVGNAYMRSLQNRTKMLLSRIIQQYKSSVTREINSLQNDFCFKWHKSFYDHIIRNEKTLNNIREYVVKNPLKWESDIENKINSKESNKDYYKQIIDG